MYQFARHRTERNKKKNSKKNAHTHIHSLTPIELLLLVLMPFSFLFRSLFECVSFDVFYHFAFRSFSKCNEMCAATLLHEEYKLQTTRPTHTEIERKEKKSKNVCIHSQMKGNMPPRFCLHRSTKRAPERNTTIKSSYNNTNYIAMHW